MWADRAPKRRSDWMERGKRFWLVCGLVFELVCGLVCELVYRLVCELVCGLVCRLVCGRMFESVAWAYPPQDCGCMYRTGLQPLRMSVCTTG